MKLVLSEVQTIQILLFIRLFLNHKKVWLVLFEHKFKLILDLKEMRPIRVFDDSSESSCSSDSESEQRVSSQTKILAMTSPASKVSFHTFHTMIKLKLLSICFQLNLSPLGSVRKTARKRLDSVSSTGSQQSVLRRSARLRSREPSPIAESPLPPSQLTFPSILEEIPEVPVVVERKSKEKKKGKAANADVHLKKRQEELEKLLDQMKPKSILNLTKLGENKKTKQAKKPVEEADDLFLIDTFGGENEEGKKDITIPSNKLEKRLVHLEVGILLFSFGSLMNGCCREKSPIRLCSEIDTGVENKDLYIDFDPFKGEVSKDPKNRIVAIKSEEIDEVKSVT